jgi:hypothetical protein
MGVDGIACVACVVEALVLLVFITSSNIELSNFF